MNWTDVFLLIGIFALAIRIVYKSVINNAGCCAGCANCRRSGKFHDFPDKSTSKNNLTDEVKNKEVNKL